MSATVTWRGVLEMNLELSADLILLDERDARSAAQRAGLNVTGVLGLLLRARKDGLIPAVKPELDALRSRAHFFVAQRLEQQIIEIAGE